MASAAPPPAQVNYWNLPRQINLPEEYKTRTFPLADDKYYGLAPGCFIPTGEWAVVSIYFVDGHDDPDIPPDYVGRLAVNIRSKKNVFLAPPEPTAGYEYQLSAIAESELLSSEEAAVVLTCSISRDKPAEAPIVTRKLLFSWNISTGRLKPIGNRVPIESFLSSLSATPYSASWFDREVDMWSGWAQIICHRENKGFAQVWKREKDTNRANADLTSFAPTDIFHSTPPRPGYSQADSEAAIFAPGPDSDHVLRMQTQALNAPLLTSQIESLNLSKAGRAIWTLDRKVVEQNLGHKVSRLFMRFPQGITAPTKTIPILATYDGSNRGTDAWLLNTTDGSIVNRYRIQDSTLYAFRPKASSNGRYLAARLNNEGLCIIDFKTEVVVHKRSFFDHVSPSLFILGITDDGTLVLTNQSSISLLPPPYDGDLSEVFQLPEFDR